MRFFAALLLTLMAAPATAELRGLVGQWSYDLAGHVTDEGDRLDFEDDLDVRRDGGRSASVEYDTGPGWWPDWRLDYGRLGARGAHNQTTAVAFGPIVVPGTSSSTRLTTDADFNATGVALRYPLGGPRLRLSLGAAAQWLEGEIVITDTSDGTQSRQPYDVVFPQVHAELRWAPGRVWALVVTGEGARYRDDRATAWRAMGELRLGPMLVQGGWQARRYALKAEDYALDARLDGFLLQLGFVLPAGRR